MSNRKAVVVADVGAAIGAVLAWRFASEGRHLTQRARQAWTCDSRRARPANTNGGLDRFD